MRHAEDPLLLADRIVRRGLGVRDGQTIRERAVQIVKRGGPIEERIMLAAVAALEEGWPGTKRAAAILAGEQARA